MEFLRIALCAAAVGFASAARPQLTFPVSARSLEPLAMARAAAHGIELTQTPAFRRVRPDDIIQIEIQQNTPGLSTNCYDQMVLLTQRDEIVGEGVDVVAGTVASECTRIVTRQALEANQDALITTVACDVNEDLRLLNTACAEIDGAVADFTITQDITRTDRPNYFVRLSTDYYRCIPFNTNGCSASEVEAVAAAVAQGLSQIFFDAEQEFLDDIDNNLAGLEPVVDVQYAVTGLVFGPGPDYTPQGIFGGADAFLTQTVIEGASRALSLQTPLAVFIRSDDNNFRDVEVLSPIEQNAASLCKNIAASLIMDPEFRQSRCIADCQERLLPQAQLNIWCPTQGQILIREGVRGLPPDGPASPIMGFQANNVGFSFSGTAGTPAQGVVIPPVIMNDPPANNVQLTLPNGNTIIRPGVGVPVSTLPPDNAGSSYKPTAVTTAVCLLFAAVSRRFC